MSPCSVRPDLRCGASPPVRWPRGSASCRRGPATVHRPDGARIRLSPDPSHAAWAEHAPVEAFGELVAGRAPNHAPGDDAAAVALVEAAYESARTGRPVTVPPRPRFR
ncbi:hypothetical protein ABZ815_50115 [Nonomuraea sp. NPDC047529]|uniref:hypothetical protein n=1 Tax=Nonomuraea sp. NPDC047529 TaxID=3155623 RepID=UPI0033C57A26